MFGLGIGYVGSPLSTGHANKVGGLLCIHSVGNDLCLPSLTWGSKPLFALCISSILMPPDFFVTWSVLDICLFLAD